MARVVRLSVRYKCAPGQRLSAQTGPKAPTSPTDVSVLNEAQENAYRFSPRRDVPAPTPPPPHKPSPELTPDKKNPRKPRKFFGPNKLW